MVIMTKMMTKNIFSIFIIVDFAIVIICLITNNYLWLINTQIAFSSSFIISLATFYSYKNNVQKSVNNEFENKNDDLDYIDKIDDPYDLYSDDVREEIILQPNKKQIQNAMKPIKQNYFLNLKNSILSFASFYRIGGYALLVVGFFYLNNNGLLHVYSYLVGFLILPISSLFSKN